MKKLIATICLIWAMAGGAGAQEGLRYPLLDWRFINNGALPQSHGYYLKEDTIGITVSNGSAEGLTADQMKIVLASSVGWRKEIVAFSSCDGGTRTQTITTGGSMIITRNSCSADTIIFRKDKIFQGMVDMYHLDPNFFWKMWSGKIITVNWTDDWNGNSQYPPSCTFPCIPLGTNPSRGIVFDTDGKADIAVWRPSSGFWFPINSSDGSRPFQQLGAVGDKPVPMDYDFDGRTDMAVWRPSTGTWFIVNSFTGAVRSVVFGANGDVPLPGDYDGDGKMDLAYWRPSTGAWRVKFFRGGAIPTVTLGANGDVPVPGNYDGDALTDMAVWQPSTGQWTIRYTDGSITTHTWGGNGDVPVPADYDGDGKTDIAVFRPSTREWFIHNSSDGSNRVELWGLSGDHLLPRDFDGDGKADLTVFRPSTGMWYITNSSDGSITQEQYGASTDIPVPTK